MTETVDIPPYILGLWTGDKYWWGSSVGITNVNPSLIFEFLDFFRSAGFGDDRIKLSVYSKNGKTDMRFLSGIFGIPSTNIKSYRFKKGKKKVFILYVNSRPLKRAFEEHENRLEDLLDTENIFQFLAGVFDADGCLERKKNRIRIGCTTSEEAERQSRIISEIIGNQPKISFYCASNEWILEMCGKEWKRTIEKILQFSKRAI